MEKGQATIMLDTGASWIYYETTRRFIPIKFSVRDRDLGSTVAEAQERIAKSVKLPTGYRMIWAGGFGDLQEAKHRLELIVPVSLVLIIGLLYRLFNSLLECLRTLSGIPFAIACHHLDRVTALPARAGSAADLLGQDLPRVASRRRSGARTLP